MTRPPGRTPRQHGAVLRALAYAFAQQELSDKGRDVRCTEITPAALARWRAEWRPAYREGQPAASWDWDRLQRKYRPDPYRFEVAIWGPRPVAGAHAVALDVLCGLAFGALSASRWIVRVQYLAGSPVSGNPLKGVVALTAAATAEAYCRTWAGAEVRFEDPLPGTATVYETQLGYQLVRPRKGKPYYSDPL